MAGGEDLKNGGMLTQEEIEALLAEAEGQVETQEDRREEIGESGENLKENPELQKEMGDAARMLAEIMMKNGIHEPEDIVVPIEEEPKEIVEKPEEIIEEPEEIVKDPEEVVEESEEDKARTMAEWKALYPKMEGESSRQYRRRLFNMSRIEKEQIERAREDVQEESEDDSSKEQPSAREKYEEMLQRRVENGELTEEEAARLREGVDQRAADKQRYEEFRKQGDLEREEILERAKAGDAEAKAFFETRPEFVEEGDGLDIDQDPDQGPEDLKQGPENPDQGPENPDRDPQQKTGGQRDDGIDVEQPLTAPEEPPVMRETADKEMIFANVDLTNDAKDAAHQIAEEMLREKRANRKGLSKLFGGVFDNMFREARIKKYEKQALGMIESKMKGEETELTDKQWGSSKAVIERFVTAMTEGLQEELIHQAAGENMEVFGVEKNANGVEAVYKYSKGEDGSEKKELLDADAPEVTAVRGMHDTIKQYAEGKMDRDSFESEMKRITAELKDKGSSADLMVDNYLELAEYAKDRVNHAEKIENVMAGFRLINAEARRNVRSEAHRDKLDQITNRIMSSKVGQFVPAEVVGAGAGMVAFALSKTARTAARLLAPGVGGAGVSAGLAALRERNRVTGDRADLARRIATGETGGDTKYDKQMLDTMYEMKPATSYTEDLLNKIEAFKAEGNEQASNELLLSLAQAESAIDFSDEKKVDLISFSSGDVSVIEQERMELDVARAQAKNLLGREQLAQNEAYQEALKNARETFEEETSSKDKVFKRLRRQREAAQAGKSALMTGVTMIAGQELVSAFSPDKYGLVDSIRDRINGTETENGGANTLLARAAAIVTGKNPNVERVIIDNPVQEGISLTDEQVQELKSQGALVESRPIVTKETKSVFSSVDEFTEKHGIKIKRDGWANNGTKFSDGNELAVRADGDKFIFTPRGNSYMPDGREIGVESAMGEGKIKMLLSLSKETQSAPIELVGTLNDQGQIEFASVNEQISDIIADKAYKYAELVYDNGVAEDGTNHVIALATAVGSGYEGELAETVEEVSRKIVYNVTTFNENTTPVTEMLSGFGIPLLTRRKELTIGGGQQAEEQPTEETGGEAAERGSMPDEVEIPVPNKDGAGDGGERVGEVENELVEREVDALLEFDWDEELEKQGVAGMDGLQLAAESYAQRCDRAMELIDMARSEGRISAQEYGHLSMKIFEANSAEREEWIKRMQAA